MAGCLEWQRNEESGPGAGCTLDPDAPAVCVHDALRDPQAETNAIGVFSMQAGEGLKQVLLLLRGHTQSLVSHADDYLTVGLGHDHLQRL